jgi:hypothetical protein
MHLTKDEEKIMNGEKGEANRKAMELLAALGDAFDAKRLIPIRSAQIAGVSYKNLGEAGLEFLEDFAKEGAKTSVLSTLNPAGMDLDRWREMGIPEDFAKGQLRVVEAYRKMGVLTTCTCTPYDISNIALKGEHVAWSESSAVIFVNSVLGARTNREGGPSSLAAAIIGKTPEYGMHFEENRKGSILVNVRAKLDSGTDWSVLGHHVGKIAGSKIPVFVGLKPKEIYMLKMLSAGLATSGGVPMFHAMGITPEAGSSFSDKPEDTVEVGEAEMKRAYEVLHTEIDEPDVVCIGCPHASITGIQKIANILQGKKVNTECWICTSSAIKSIADRMGFTRAIEDSGAKLLTDTCFIVSPIEKLGYKTVLTNSAKTAHYAPSYCGAKAGCASLREIMEKVAR